MTRILALFAIVALSGIAVFGVWLPHGHAATHENCFATRAVGGSCPLSLGALAFVAFHLDAVRALGLATAAFLLFAVLFISGTPRPAVPRTIRSAAAHGESHTPLRTLLLSWLSLHEASPSAA